MAKAGEILGLMAGLSGVPYEVTAETIRPCQVAFVRREDFSALPRQAPRSASAGVARQMSMQYQAACEQLHTLGFVLFRAREARATAASLVRRQREAKDGMRITIPLTHEEIAEFIGNAISRNLVTRTLTCSSFKTTPSGGDPGIDDD